MCLLVHEIPANCNPIRISYVAILVLAINDHYNSHFTLNKIKCK